MPDATALQKFDAIVAHPLTETGHTWLIKPVTRGLGGDLSAAVRSLFVSLREPVRMTFPVFALPARQLCALALTASAMLAMPVSAFAQATTPATTGLMAPPTTQAVPPPATTQAVPPAAARA